MDFQTLFRSQCLITDGAMGTYYSEIYGKESGSPENDNLTDPQKIEDIHREYIKPERISCGRTVSHPISILCVRAMQEV